MFVAPALGRWLWKRYKSRTVRRQGLPGEVAEPNTTAPQEQIRAMEDEVDVPGGIRP